MTSSCQMTILEAATGYSTESRERLMVPGISQNAGWLQLSLAREERGYFKDEGNHIRTWSLQLEDCASCLTVDLTYRKHPKWQGGACGGCGESNYFFPHSGVRIHSTFLLHFLKYKSLHLGDPFHSFPGSSLVSLSDHPFYSPFLTYQI